MKNFAIYNLIKTTFVFIGLLIIFTLTRKEKDYKYFLNEVNNNDFKDQNLTKYLNENKFLAKWIVEESKTKNEKEVAEKIRANKTKLILIHSIAMKKYLEYLNTIDNKHIEIYNFATGKRKCTHWAFDDLYGSPAVNTTNYEKEIMFRRGVVAKDILLFMKDKNINYNYGLFYAKEGIDPNFTTQNDEIYNRNIKDFNIFSMQIDGITNYSWYYVIYNKKTKKYLMVFENACTTSLCTEFELKFTSLFMVNLTEDKIIQHNTNVMRYIDILRENKATK
jgi:hypothetical protein